ncbi:MAG: 30S ribosomal protein S9 [Candidatus Altiarchaeota archaeon]|nr:30S ribosomal protein S9 [Candidatus Altiarchaeota archaeon]
MEQISTVGKRKIAVARATLVPGTGNLTINSKPLEIWGPKYLCDRIREPLFLSGDLWKKADIKINVRSGGSSAQADAVRTAVGKALAEFGGEKIKKTFLEYDRTLLVADMRQGEPWKPGRSKPRAAAQKGKR